MRKGWSHTLHRIDTHSPRPTERYIVYFHILPHICNMQSVNLENHLQLFQTNDFPISRRWLVCVCECVCLVDCCLVFGAFVSLLYYCWLLQFTIGYIYPLYTYIYPLCNSCARVLVCLLPLLFSSGEILHTRNEKLKMKEYTQTQLVHWKRPKQTKTERYGKERKRERREGGK